MDGAAAGDRLISTPRVSLRLRRTCGHPGQAVARWTWTVGGRRSGSVALRGLVREQRRSASESGRKEGRETRDGWLRGGRGGGPAQFATGHSPSNDYEASGGGFIGAGLSDDGWAIGRNIFETLCKVCRIDETRFDMRFQILACGYTREDSRDLRPTFCPETYCSDVPTDRAADRVAAERDADLAAEVSMESDFCRSFFDRSRTATTRLSEIVCRWR